MVNRLSTQTSPYLRQHADNPIEWYPWGEEALSRARAEDKPLFISVGYASCHWCHVMAHESFESEAIGALLARSFISIKVDREERPDLDAIYMAAVLAQNGSGGWPMSVFCTPEGRPFFAGTYFPAQARPGYPSFSHLVNALADAWTTQREAVEEQAQSFVEAIARHVNAPDALAPRSHDVLPAFDDLLDRVISQLTTTFDAQWGGFGDAPKFPRPTWVELCLRHHARRGDPRSLAMATTTLDAMAAGGLYDHLAGGFARYSTDRQWLVPHFEKMLTDQALLGRAYLHAWQQTRSDGYLQVLTETLDAMLDDLGAPSGGLCSSIDADAGGHEGAHATFTEGQLNEALEHAGLGSLGASIASFYGVSSAGNWESTNVLHRPMGASLARPAEVEAARVALLTARRARPQPALDTKVLTEWNAMAVSTLAEAAMATGIGRWQAAAVSIAELLFERLRRSDGRWLRSLHGHDARHLALAADYAWVLDCTLRLAELTGQAAWIERASETALNMLDLFASPDGSGPLCTTGRDAEALIVRPRDVFDGAVPSANAVAMKGLFRLGALSGEGIFFDAAMRIGVALAPLLESNTMGFADVVAATSLITERTEVVITGNRPDLLGVVRSRWLPDAVVAWGEPTPSPLWSERQSEAAYVCHHFACLLPARDTATLQSQLAASGS